MRFDITSTPAEPPRPGLVDRLIAALEALAVQGGDGLLSLGPVRHLIFS